MDWRFRHDMALADQVVSVNEQKTLAKFIAADLARVILPAMGVRIR